MVEVQCDRCKRVEYVDEDEAQAVRFVASMGASTSSGEVRVDYPNLVEARFDDLCKPCQQTIQKHLLQISKDFKGKSPDRTKPVAKKKVSAKADPSIG
jgi:hypothetical protein